MNYVVYIAETKTGRYYVGQTKRLEQRTKEHGRKRGAAFLRDRDVRILYAEKCETLTQARSREQQIKGWSRSKKTALIAGNLDLLRQLSRHS